MLLKFPAVLAAGLLLANCAPEFAGSGPAILLSPALNADHALMADETRLSVTRWQPDETMESQAVVIALHGFNDYRHTFSLTGPYFAEDGIITYAYDQRGFGESNTPGVWPGEKALVDDLVAFIGLVRKKHPDQPLFLLGESMGAAVALLAAAGERTENAVCGVILSAPAVWGWSNLNLFYALTLGVTARIAPNWKLTGRGLDILPSDNIEMLREMARDPLVIKETRTDSIYGLVDLMDNAARAASRIRTPALILYGEKDQVVPRKPIEKLRKQLRSEHKFILYPEGYHLLLRDLNRKKVWRDILHFIRENQHCM